MIARNSVLGSAEGGRDQNKMLNPPKTKRRSHTDRFLLGDAAPPCFYGSLELTNRSYEVSAMICFLHKAHAKCADEAEVLFTFLLLACC